MKKYLLIVGAVCMTITGFSQGANGLIAHWSFNGNANDVSGHGLNGTVVGATPTTGYNGEANTAYLFNGTSNYISVPYNTLMNTGTFSICALIKPMGFYSGFCQGNIILGRDEETADDHYELEIADNAYDNDCNAYNPTNENFEVANSSSGGEPNGYWLDTPVNMNQWYCVVGTFDGDSTSLYVDGILRRKFASPNLFSAGIGGLNIGASSASNAAQYPYWFNGAIDEIRLYNRALSVNEVGIFCDSAETICPNFIIGQPGNDTVSSGGTAHFSIADTGVGTYQWQQNSGTGFVNLSNAGIYSGVTTNTLTITNPTLTISNDMYRCIRSNASSCTDTSSSATLVVENNAGINNVNLKNEIIISPNPAHSVVTVTLSSTGNGNIQLINALGQVITDKKISGNIMSFDLSNLPAAMYLLRTQCNGQVIFSKIIKE